MKQWEIENRDYQAWRVGPALEAFEKRRKEKGLKRAERWLKKFNPDKEEKLFPPHHIFEKGFDK